MTKSIYFLMSATLFFTFPSYLLSSEKIENISTGSAVIFNTLCSKCHEGECSGRLSFDTGSKTASSHIKRYTGDDTLSKKHIKEFFTLLNHMKKACEIYMPGNEKWQEKDLSHFALPSSKGYFIPLGTLEKGTYRIVIETKEDTHFQLEILSDHFEHFLNRQICPERKDNILQFTVDKAVPVFLRIQSRNPIHIVSMKMKATKEH